MIVRTLRAVCAGAVDRVTIVLGHRAPDLRAAIEAHAPYQRDIVLTVADDHASGLAASLRAGLRAMADNPPDAVLVCLGDMPGLGPTVIDRLIARHQQDRPPVTVPVQGGRHGHPVLWDRSMIPRLMALDGDRGGGALIRALGPRVATVPADDTIHQDFDTPARLDLFAASAAPSDG